MRLSLITALAALPLIAGCGRTDNAAAPAAPAVAARAAPAIATPGDAALVDAAPVGATPVGSTPRWHLVAGGDGTALAADDASGGTAMRMWCTRGAGRLSVNVPGFTPIASEERMSFGQGGEVVALVADASGDATRGGVTAATAVPASLRTLLSGPVTATYGAQVSGPHPTPPSEVVSAFVAACAPRAVDTGDAPPAPGSAATPPPRAGACLVDEGRAVPANRLRAVGTEPFWGARVEGRCVTYSQPGNPDGTRVWTRFSGTTEAGVWTGALDGKPFVMRTRPREGCSDGMSDTRYPIAVSLTVGGEQRNGCAAPR